MSRRLEHNRGGVGGTEVCCNCGGDGVVHPPKCRQHIGEWKVLAGHRVGAVEGFGGFWSHNVTTPLWSIIFSTRGSKGVGLHKEK